MSISRRRFKIFNLVFIAALVCSTSAYAQGGSLSHSNGSNTTSIGIGPNSSFVLFSGGSNLAVDSLEFSIDIIPMQTGLGGVANPPPVTNISGLGIFSGATASFTPASLSASSDAEGLLSIPNSVSLIDNAPVAEVFFDTTGLSDGDTFAYGVTGDFINGNERFETVNVLTFFATVEAVPEPSSAGLLLALGSFTMLRRKRG